LLAVTAGPSAAVGLLKRDKQKKAEKILAENYVPGDGWEAYFRDENGRTRPVLEPAEVHADREWMGLTFTDYFGPKIRLAVMKILNRTPYGDAIGTQWHGIEVPLSGIEELLTTALYNTNRFDLVERKRIGTALDEQDFGATDRVSPVTAAEVGKILGAQYLIYGTVNEWTADRGGSGGFLGGLKGGKNKAEVAMSFSVTDATSGQLVFQTTQRATAGSWGISFAGLGKTSNAPIGYAVQACINKAAYALAIWMKDRPWRGSIVKVADGKVYINAGSDEGLEMGMELTALAKGEELIDPETGLSLGADLEAVGSLQVIQVAANYSITAVIEGCDGLESGDRVELARTARPTEAASLSR
jgi:curli biogenesis system outer membrane secretion channel CsgG